ncbi:unnamed protein product [Commensalibacter papalotli (ex Botero et al. 2024)]|nr:unnamed protein product [Commensalibacter papalotli (ex Botero et al. 2024)]
MASIYIFLSDEDWKKRYSFLMKSFSTYSLYSLYSLSEINANSSQLTQDFAIDTNVLNLSVKITDISSYIYFSFF